MEAFLICTRIPFSWGLLTPRRSLFEGLFGCSLWVRRVAEKSVDDVFLQTLIILKRDFFINDPFPVLKGGFHTIIGKHVFSDLRYNKSRPTTLQQDLDPALEIDKKEYASCNSNQTVPTAIFPLLSSVISAFFRRRPEGGQKNSILFPIMAAAASLISACGVRTTRRWAKESPWYGKKPISFTPF